MDKGTGQRQQAQTWSRTDRQAAAHAPAGRAIASRITRRVARAAAAVLMLVGAVMALAGGCKRPTAVISDQLFLAGGTPVPVLASAISSENAGRVRLLASWGSGSTGQLCFSPDGRLLAVASAVGIYLYDLTTLAQVRLIETDAPVHSVAFSPDGQVLASGSGDRTVRLWQAGNGALLGTLWGHTAEVTEVAFSPDGATILSGSGDGTARLWRAIDGAPLATLSPPAVQFSGVPPQESLKPVASVAFSPDGAMIAMASSAYDEHTVDLWQASGTRLRTLEHEDLVWDVAFSPDGQALASGMADSTVGLWRVGDGALLRTLEGHTGRVERVAFSPDGQVLASGSQDTTVRLWRVSDGALLQTLEGHSERILGLAFSPDGRLLASGSWGGTVRLWGDAPSLAEVTAVQAKVTAAQATVTAPAEDTPTPFSSGPRFVNHAPPEFRIDLQPFLDAGCTAELGCPHAVLATLGCRKITILDSLGGLEPAYPIAECHRKEPPCCVYDRWGSCVDYVVYLQDQFVRLSTRDEFQTTFAPIDGDDEALSYALALTGLVPVYGQQPYQCPQGFCFMLRASRILYMVDVVEDTHVDRVSDGYVVHLFSEDKSWDRRELIAVSVHVSREGEIREESRQTAYVVYGKEVLE